MKNLIITIFLLICPMLLFAEEAPVAVLEYFDDPDEITIYDFTGRHIEDIYFGTELLIGFGIKTGASFAELRLSPNGSIIKLSPMTFLKIKELQGVSGTTRNNIAHIEGKIRVIAARVMGENYLVETPSIAMGVRGTDFIVEIDTNSEALILVNDGIVDVYNPYTGFSIEIIRGQIANTRNQILSIMEAEMASVEQMNKEFQFVELIPEDVPKFDFEEYYNKFEYFEDLEKEKYLEYFADDDFFDDFKEYMERFEEYYQQEMEDFKVIFEEELKQVKDSILEDKKNYENEMKAFEEYMNNNK